jgi:23S rRNA pseudouridine2605 synthase
MEERIQKLIAQAGVASRRAAEEMIKQGRVKINGDVATLGQKADLQKDEIRVDGRVLPRPERLHYYIVHKPRGYISSTVEDEQIFVPTVLELVKSDVRLYPVGRLDVNSEGLVLLTNDGDLTNRITHPRYGHEKTYKVLLEGRVNEEKLNTWRSGVTLPDGFRAGPVKVKTIESDRDGTWVRVVMREGHKRQIRETAEVLGHTVKRIIRTHIGPLALGDLPPGKSRELTHEEVAVLKDVMGAGKKRRLPQQGSGGGGSGRKSGPRRPAASSSEGTAPRRTSSGERPSRPGNRSSARPSSNRKPRGE